jgi:hypothetical protein
MTNDPWQGLTVLVDGVEVVMSLYWVPSLGWVADIDGIVNGIAVIPMIPIFKQYDYPGILFASEYDEIGRDQMVDSVIAIASEEELEGKAGVLEIDPSLGVVLV